MADIKDFINPYVMCGRHKLLEALRAGKKTGKELVFTHRVCKTIKQLANVVGSLNTLNGIRVRCKGIPTDETAVWEMDIANPTSPLFRNITPGSAGIVPGIGGTMPAFVPAPASKMGHYIPVPDFRWMEDAAREGDNLFFHGPTGSGKTETAKALAQSLKAIFIRQNFNGETVIDNMIGSTKVTVEEGVSVTEFQDGELTRACRLAAKGERVLYLADEVQAGKPEVLFMFHRILEVDKNDGSRSIEVDGEEIKIKGGCLTIIGTGNSFKVDETGLYQGSQMMNAAFLNRWGGGVYYIDYAPNEAEILQAAGIAHSVSASLVEMAVNIRKEAKAQSNPVICSTRQIIAVGKKAMRWGCRRAIELVYLNTLLSDERKLVDPIIVKIKWPK